MANIPLHIYLAIPPLFLLGLWFVVFSSLPSDTVTLLSLKCSSFVDLPTSVEVLPPFLFQRYSKLLHFLIHGDLNLVLFFCQQPFSHKVGSEKLQMPAFSTYNTNHKHIFNIKYLYRQQITNKQNQQVLIEFCIFPSNVWLTI